MSLRDFNTHAFDDPTALHHEPLGNGAGLADFHTVIAEESEPNNTPKIVGAVAVALMVAWPAVGALRQHGSLDQADGGGQRRAAAAPVAPPPQLAMAPDSSTSTPAPDASSLRRRRRRPAAVRRLPDHRACPSRLRCIALRVAQRQPRPPLPTPASDAASVPDERGQAQPRSRHQQAQVTPSRPSRPQATPFRRPRHLRRLTSPAMVAVQCGGAAARRTASDIAASPLRPQQTDATPAPAAPSPQPEATPLRLRPVMIAA